MNKKLIAAAVAAVIAAPVATMADITVYGRVNNALDFNDTEGEGTDVDISNVSSRFGMKGSADVGNGLTAHGRYEFATVTDKEQPNVADLRIGTVGLSGGFGRVDVGNQWSAYYNTIGTHLDPTYTLGYFLYSSQALGPYRASNTVKYSNSFGPVNLEIDARINGNNEAGAVAEKISGDGGGIGVSFDATENITIAGAYDFEDRNDNAEESNRMGLVARAEFGNFWGSLGWQRHENDLLATNGERDHAQLWLGTSFGEKTKAMLGYGEVDIDGVADDPSALIIGVYHSLGGGLKLYYEGTDFDGGSTAADQTVHLLGMRIDF